MKKRISIKSSRFENDKLICESSDDDVLNFSTEEEMIKLLKMVKFMKIDRGTIYQIFSISNFGFVSPMKNLWLDAMEFLENFYFVLKDEFFDVNMEIAQKLNHPKVCVISNYLPSEKLLKFVDAFPILASLTCVDHNVDDELLTFLASKSSKSYPWKRLIFVFVHAPATPFPSGFSIGAVEHFFRHASFIDESQIFLDINAALPEVEDMFKRIGKYEVSLLKQEEKEVKMKLKKIDEEIFITFAMLLNL
uniref:Uncharacterized protein n=1 Tax=Panagrolaimus sp. JU765 TaxID=591449 RepID=A0AC34Q1D0_9BILA